MLCERCQSEKPTPVVFRGKSYCLGCGVSVLEDAQEAELELAKIRLDLNAAKEELANIDKKLEAANVLNQELFLQKEDIEKKLAELEKSTKTLKDSRNEVDNRIDKFDALLVEQSKGQDDVGAVTE